MELSSYQTTALDFVKQSSQNLVLGAVAGSGKTTMLKLMAEVLRQQNLSVLYLAFNSEIVKDVESKLLPLGVTVKTFHSYGKQALYKSKVQQYKYWNYVSETDLEVFAPLQKWQISKIVEQVRIAFCKVCPDSVLDAMIRCNIEMSDDWIDQNIENFSACVNMWIKMGMDNWKQDGIDFVDMLCIPACLPSQYPLQKFDVILVDECQDLNKLMQRMVQHCMKRGSRVIAVGDRAQAINAFAGADSNSFDNLISLLDAEELPLSVCYRCPDAVLELAAKYVPHIEGTGKNGTVNYESYQEFIHSVEANDLVICRKNAPLLKTCFRLMASGHKVTIKGKGFSDYLLSLIKLVEKEEKDFDLFSDTLNSIILKKISKAKSEEKVEILTDARDCLETLVTDAPDVDSFKDLKSLIGRVYDNDMKNVIVLSSFHRSKGLQNSKVYILQDKPLAEPGLDQESNLSYVAITRALDSLILVTMAN